MGLAKGTRLGQYEVLELIGKGGMGEVYRGHDTQLKRDVALKVLPDQFSRDPDRLARFRREAELLASLNHPNIAAIYGVYSEGGRNCLVMELVPGETLHERVLREGPLEVDDALRLCSQICEALEHAHEKNIIHRDLKPANVKVTPDGKVKVLDFGLAKAFAGDSAGGNTPAPIIDTHSPTLSTFPMSEASPSIPGQILGTASYMSPEQARGKVVDRRSDIWAFGCVLYELLTGKEAFTGESVTEILGAIHHKEPDWSALPEATPPAIRALLRRCLQKDVAKRSRDAVEIRIQIEEARTASSAIAVPVAAQTHAPRRWLLLGTLVCVVVAVLTGIAVWTLKPAPKNLQQASRSVIPLASHSLQISTDAEVMALSPDGTHLAYIAGNANGQQLYLRAMDALEAAPIAGTEGAYSPFFSPDGLWIGFVAGNRLKKVSVSGGAVLTLCNAGSTHGAAWGPKETIIVSLSPIGPLSQVPAAGGEPQALTKLNSGELNHRWPQFLLDGKAILFTTQTSADSNVEVQRLDTGERKVLIQGGSDGRYVPTGHLVYYRAGTIMAVRFDPIRLEVKGNPAPALDGIMSSNSNPGAGQFSFSNLGSLVYVPGGPQSSSTTLAWVDRHGAAQALSAPPRNYRAPRLSPDGRQVAVGIGNDVWIYDIPRDTLTRLTFEASNAASGAAWTQDGKRVVYPSNRAGPINLFWKAADGSGSEERLTTSEHQQRAGTVSPDGRFELFSEVSPGTASDLLVLPLEGDRKPRAFLKTQFQEYSGQFSPDGRWVAYTSDESGRLEVYVRPFPGPGGKWQVSTDGGSEVAWSPKGKELFYRNGGQKEKMMVVEYQTQPTFTADKPRLLFEGNYVANAPTNAGAFYSVSPDGQRFLMMKKTEQSQAALTQINLIQNWFEELNQKVPAGK